MSALDCAVGQVAHNDFAPKPHFVLLPCSSHPFLVRARAVVLPLLWPVSSVVLLLVPLQVALPSIKALAV